VIVLGMPGVTPGTTSPGTKIFCIGVSVRPFQDLVMFSNCVWVGLLTWTDRIDTNPELAEIARKVLA
jgi:hypothetical protein